MTEPAFLASVAEILGVPSGSLKLSDTRDSLEDWSSLEDVNIMALIQSEFGLEPDPAFVQAETVGELLQILESKGVFSST